MPSYNGPLLTGNKAKEPLRTAAMWLFYSLETNYLNKIAYFCFECLLHAELQEAALSVSGIAPASEVSASAMLL
jgi:hypothetical protein